MCVWSKCRVTSEPFLVCFPSLAHDHAMAPISHLSEMQIILQTSAPMSATVIRNDTRSHTQQEPSLHQTAQLPFTSRRQGQCFDSSRLFACSLANRLSSGMTCSPGPPSSAPPFFSCLLLTSSSQRRLALSHSHTSPPISLPLEPRIPASGLAANDALRALLLALAPRRIATDTSSLCL